MSYWLSLPSIYTSVKKRPFTLRMDKGPIFVVSLIGLIIAYYLYTRAWRHPQGFVDSGKPSSFKETEVKAKDAAATKVVMDEIANPPFALDPIQSVDDYEYNLIFKNEGDRGLTKETRDRLMSAYPMDWSTQPPSSAQFQAGLTALKEAFANAPPQPNVNPYKEIDGTNMTPPDTLAAERKEREILATYVPKKPGELTTYDVEDARDIIGKIYDAKGLVPTYKQTGPNQFTILNTTKKGEEVVWEDEAPVAPVQGQQAAATQGANAQAGEGTIIVPAVAQEVSQGLDPFFTPGTKTRDGRWDYTRWTPGLERMFAPTEPMTNWY